jgi:hypothetical protein
LEAYLFIWHRDKRNTMNYAPTPNHASCPAIGGRLLARALRGGAAACVAAAVVCAPAFAQRNGDPRYQDQQHAQDPRMMPQRAPEQAPQPRFDPRTFDSRQDPRVQDPRVQEPHHPNPNASSGRMTPDERRDLRRQINEAGMDLYTRPPRR